MLPALTHHGSGKSRLKWKTRSRSAARLARLVESANASWMKSATCSTWISFMPRVVTAGVPMRMPLGTKLDAVLNQVKRLTASSGPNTAAAAGAW